MSARMEIRVTIIDEDGNEVIKTISEKDVPNLQDFDRLGFREGFHQLETAVLDARKESAEAAVEGYLSKLSEKKQEK